MRSHTKITIALLCTLHFILNNMSAAIAAQETSVSKILGDGVIEALTYWRADGNTFLVAVSSHVKTLEDAKLSGRKLVIYKRQNSGFLKSFEYDAALDHFVGMFPLGDVSNTLATIWTGGSAYHLRVFSLSTGKISLALESGSHNFPEFADLDNDGKEEILISEGAFVIDARDGKVLSRPEKTDVYKWDGETYVLTKTVPWKSRFCVK